MTEIRQEDAGVGDAELTLTDVDSAKGSSLAGPAIVPVRGLLKLLVQADASRSKLTRLRAMVLLLAVLVPFAVLGYYLPTLL